ncbi:kinase-like domain-containing protein, partial [Xylogone sp. PMI_703]
MSCDTAAKTIVKVTTNTYFPYYPHNSKFLVCNEEASFTSDIFSQDSSRAEEAGDSSPVPGKVRETYLRIGTDHNPKDQGLGFVFGRDRDNADILLDVREHSPISKKLFTIKIVWDTGVILIKNLSSHGINIHSIYYGSIKMKSQRVLKHGDILTVRLAEFDLTIQLPDHTQHAEQAEKYWAEYLARFASGIPSLRDLDLRSLRSSTGASRMIYSLESEIGRGKHGLVYRAIHQRTGQVFAAKKYYEMQASALREGAIMQHISHRNIVKFHDYISTGQASPLLIMEFIPGKMSLASEHQSSPFSILELRAIDSQLLCALSYLHQKQIIHGNLKLTKVLLVYRNPIYIKVTDFREASISDHQRIPYLRDIYRAPEIVDGRYSNKVDIWSVGIMTLELSDLALPQCPETPDELLCVIENHLRITPSPLTNFISRLVQHNPDRRPSADESVCDDFFNI